VNKLILITCCCFIFPLSASDVITTKNKTNIKYSKFTEPKNFSPSASKKTVKAPSMKKDVIAVTQSNQVQDTPLTKKTDGVDIYKGTVKENILRLAQSELNIPAQNVEIRYLPCELAEPYTYTIPEYVLENRYERLTYYAGKYSFFATFNLMTNTVTLDYRGPDVFDNCRKSK
tara:strand:- start:32 stop:550 length:519 start_codon:yes stop_codon:yes gene_type:complete